MLHLERLSPTAAHWTEQQYFDLSAGTGSPERLALLAEENDRSGLMGFLVARHVSPDWELENIVVSEAVRGKGIGMCLMQAFLARAQQTNSESVFLEVRESNKAARALYEKLAFRQTGRRKSYYTNPLEDSVLYSKSLREGRISH